MYGFGLRHGVERLTLDLRWRELGGLGATMHRCLCALHALVGGVSRAGPVHAPPQGFVRDLAELACKIRTETPLLWTDEVATAYDGALVVFKEKDRVDITDETQRMLDGIAESKDLVADIFAQFDSNKDGVLDAAELRDVAYALGEVLDEEQALRCIAALDTDGNGTIDLEEFANWLRGRLGQDPNKDGGGLKLRLMHAKLMTRYMGRYISSAMHQFNAGGGSASKLVATGNELVGRMAFRAGTVDADVAKNGGMTATLKVSPGGDLSEPIFKGRPAEAGSVA